MPPIHCQYSVSFCCSRLSIPWTLFTYFKVQKCPCLFVCLSPQQALLTGHVPPGYDPLMGATCGLHAVHNDRLLAVMREYADVIVALITGHYHVDVFRILYDEQGNRVTLVTIYNTCICDNYLAYFKRFGGAPLLSLASTVLPSVFVKFCLALFFCLDQPASPRLCCTFCHSMGV